MKKLMMAAAIVCAAVAANAATYDWNATGNFYWADTVEGTELVGSTIYVFDGNKYSMATVMETLGTGDKSVLADALNHGVVDELAAFDFSGSGITDDGNDPAYIKAFLVALTKDEAYATSYDYPAIKVVDAVIASGASITPDWAVATLPGGADWVQVAPEPTSGLLLLIGVAGLALKRRRA